MHFHLFNHGCYATKLIADLTIKQMPSLDPTKVKLKVEQKMHDFAKWMKNITRGSHVPNRH
jgi:hypothetical protein